MNPFAKIDCEQSISLQSIIESQTLPKDYLFSAVVYGFRTFKEATILNSLCREQGMPYYCLNSSGLFGFFFADLGSLPFRFNHKSKASNEDEVHSIENSQSMQKILDDFMNTDKKLSWNKRQLNKSTKYLLLSLLIKYKEEIDQKMSLD